MIDNIKIKRIWQDDDFFEICITCNNQIITASTEVYVTDSGIDQFKNEIEQFLGLEKSEVLWKSGERGDSSTPCVEFRVFTKDSSGHVLIECFMELNDGGSLEKHNCCFFVNAELGMLYDFSSKIDELKRPELGVSISLLDEDECL